MGRPPLPVGTFGKITFLGIGQTVRARARFRDADGLTRRVDRFGPSRAAAERRLREALRDRSGPAGDGRITRQSQLREVAAFWLEELADSRPAAGTLEHYQRTLNKHVLPGLGGLRMREVDVPAADRFIKAVRKNHGPSAARSVKNVLSLVLAVAVRHGALGANPVREVAKVRSGKRSRPRALGADETIDLEKHVYAEAGHHPQARMGDELDLGDIVRYLRGTGCRIGEALAVRGGVVDLEAGVIEVNATLVRITGKGMVFQERTKSDAGWRIIAVPEDVVELCRRRLANPRAAVDRLVWVLSPAGIYRQVPASELGLIFLSDSGGLRNPSNTQRGLKAVLSRLGDYEWVVPHTFRKTVATRLDEAGCTARQIADHLGHARPSTTQDLYMGRGVACAEAARVL